MIPIFLLILKIIGLILLGILGLILGILLFVLFSAIRYRIDGSKQGEALEGQVKVTWLLWILSVTALYQDGLHMTAKVFGKTIWKSDSEEDAKEDLKDRQREHSQSAGNSLDSEYPAETDWVGTDSVRRDLPIDSRPAAESAEEGSAKSQPQRCDDKREVETKQTQEKQAQKQQTQRQQTQEQAADKTIHEVHEAPPSYTAGQDGQESHQSSENRLIALFRRLVHKVSARISALIQKLKFSIQSICGKLKQAEETISRLQEKRTMIQAFIQDPANQKSFRLILRQTRKIFRHLLPGKGSAQITFGLEDPYRMGQLLSAASLIYPAVHKVLTLHPVFDQTLLEGEVHIRGHVRIGVLLGHVLRLLFDRNIRKQLWKQIHSSKSSET